MSLQPQTPEVPIKDQQPQPKPISYDALEKVQNSQRYVVSNENKPLPWWKKPFVRNSKPVSKQVFPVEQPASQYIVENTYVIDALGKTVIDWEKTLHPEKNAKHVSPADLKGFFTREEMERIIYYAQIYAKRGQEIKGLLHDSPHPGQLADLAQTIQHLVPEERITTIRDEFFGIESIHLSEHTTARIVNHVLTKELAHAGKAQQDAVFSPAELTYVSQLIADGTPLKEIREVVRIILSEISSREFQPVAGSKHLSTGFYRIRTNTDDHIYLDDRYKYGTHRLGADFWQGIDKEHAEKNATQTTTEPK